MNTNRLFCLARAFYFLVWLGCSLVCLLSETEVLPTAYLPADPSTEYALQMLCVVLTLCCVPAALRLFTLGRVKRHMKPHTPQLAGWSMARIAIMAVAVFANTIVYYGLHTTLSPAFCLLISLTALVFCYPSQEAG